MMYIPRKSVLTNKMWRGWCVLVLLLATGMWATAATKPLVSLPVQHVLELLRQDPEMVKAVKEAVIEQAAEEGRIVRPSELTDPVLFRMVADDPKVALLATVEVARRAANSANTVAKGGAMVAPVESDETTTALEPISRVNTLGGGRGASDARSQALASPGVAQTLSEISATAASAQDASSGPAEDKVPGQPEFPTERPAQRDDAHRDKKKSAEQTPIFTSVQHPYAHVPALDDMYLQVTSNKRAPERFGASIFRNGTGNSDELPMDMPVGPEYVVGPGDGLKVELWGGISQRLQRVVDREGRVALPEVGMVQVAGHNLGEVQQAIQAALRTQFREVQAEISLTRLRSVRVYVVGDVERPGAYDISALSTPLNALYAAGGPTQRGSMRVLRHYRGKQLIQEVDAYELILHGMRSGLQRLEAGDTVLVPPAGREITVQGMVRRPAIYELRGEEDLAAALEIAGGVLPTGTMRHIDVERTEAHEKRVMLSFDVAEGSDRGEIATKLKGFAVQDEDKVRVSPIVSYTEKSVYVDGHVFNPGKRAWREGMKVRDVVRSYSELLPEPYRAHAEIVRLLAPDFHPQVIGFNLGDVMAGAANGPDLQPFDTVRVFGRYDFEDAPEINVSGEVRNPGVHGTNGETRLADAIYLAGGLTPDALLDNVHVFRRIEGSKVQVISADLRKALAGDPVENVTVVPRDQVVVHRNMAKVDPAVVYISGQVVAPGRYPLGEAMTASELVRIAGGFRRGAYTQTADLARVSIQQNEEGIKSQTAQVNIGKAVAGDKSEDIELRDGDVLSIRQIAGWDDIGASMTIRGEVAHAGTYGITPGEKLSSVLKRAGGFYRGAYAAGAVLRRVEVEQLAEKSKADLIERLEEAAAEAPQAPSGANAQEQAELTRAIQSQQRQIISTLKHQAVDGRMVLRIGDDIGKWENTPDDVEVRDGDVLIIPKRPTFILVSGQVYNRAAITWVPGKKAGWYLKAAGGPTENANKKAVFIIRANGLVIGQGGGSDVLGVKLQPGDAVVVPERIVGKSSAWRGLMGAAQVMSAFALTASFVAGL